MTEYLISNKILSHQLLLLEFFLFKIYSVISPFQFEILFIFETSVNFQNVLPFQQITFNINFEGSLGHVIIGEFHICNLFAIKLM